MKTIIIVALLFVCMSALANAQGTCSCQCQVPDTSKIFSCINPSIVGTISGVTDSTGCTKAACQTAFKTACPSADCTYTIWSGSSSSTTTTTTPSTTTTSSSTSSSSVSTTTTSTSSALVNMYSTSDCTSSSSLAATTIIPGVVGCSSFSCSKSNYGSSQYFTQTCGAATAKAGDLFNYFKAGITSVTVDLYGTDSTCSTANFSSSVLYTFNKCVAASSSKSYRITYSNSTGSVTNNEYSNADCSGNPVSGGVQVFLTQGTSSICLKVTTGTSEYGKLTLSGDIKAVAACSIISCPSSSISSTLSSISSGVLVFLSLIAGMIIC